MAELIATSPCAGLLPFENGAAELSEVDPGPMTSLSPFRGRADALSAALESAHGLALPGPNRCTQAGGARALWFGHAHVLLTGVRPAESLSDHAALTDQGDAWAVLRLEGERAAEVLARLVPVDLRDGHFAQGHAARTLVGHMQGAVTRVGPRAFEVMVFRSMGPTLVAELRTAMEQVAARGPAHVATGRAGA